MVKVEIRISNPHPRISMRLPAPPPTVPAAAPSACASAAI